MNMARKHSRTSVRSSVASTLCALLAFYTGMIPGARAYSFGYTVADMRLPAAQSGGTSCPQPDHWNTSLPGGINRRWSTSLGTNPVTILTLDQTPTGQLIEIESVISESFAVWTGVSGSSLTPASLAALQRLPDPAPCNSTDGLNTICLNQNDPAFTTGVLSFTRVTTADFIGDQPVLNHPASTFVGEIVDADILINPTGNAGVFATPAALAANPQAYDLESVLTHELGHFFGFEHSGVWSAAMFPFVPPPGAFLNPRPSTQTPDAPLADDDRTGLRVLYPNPNDTFAHGRHQRPHRARQSVVTCGATRRLRAFSLRKSWPWITPPALSLHLRKRAGPAVAPDRPSLMAPTRSKNYWLVRCRIIRSTWSRLRARRILRMSPLRC